MQCTLDYVLGYLKRSSIIRRIKEDPSRWGFRWDSDGIWGSGMDPKAEGAITLLLFRNIGKDHLTSILKKNHTLILSKTYLGRYTRIFWCHLVVYALCCMYTTGCYVFESSSPTTTNTYSTTYSYSHTYNSNMEFEHWSSCSSCSSLFLFSLGFCVVTFEQRDSYT